MKNTLVKTLVSVLIALCLVTTVSMCIPVKASSGISPLTYFEHNFSFTGTFNVADNCTGMFLDVRVKGTASNNNNETITLEIYVSNTGKTHTRTFLTDGQYHTYKNIYLGLKGGSSVRFTFTGANPEIAINMYMDITS